MKHFRLFFAAVLAVCMTSCDSCGGDEDTLEGYQKVDVEIFKQKIDAEKNAGEEPQILDYRSAEDFAAGHIPGAINIDGTNPATWADDNGSFMQAVTANFTTTKNIYIYGKSGWNSTGLSLPGRVANTWGKEKTWNLEGGYSKWVDKGYTVEK